MVDSRPLSSRRKAPIDRLPPLQREAWTKPQYRKKHITRGYELYKPQRKGAFFGRKTYSQSELEGIARSGKTPDGMLMEYPQYYLKNLGKDQKYKKIESIASDVSEEDTGEELGEEYDEDRFRTFNTKEHKTVVSAIESPAPPEIYYEVEGKVSKASVIDRIFYFTETGKTSIE